MTQQENAETTPTLFVSVGEVRFAYRRFGKAAEPRSCCSSTFVARWTIGIRLCSMGLRKTAQ